MSRPRGIPVESVDEVEVVESELMSLALSGSKNLFHFGPVVFGMSVRMSIDDYCLRFSNLSPDFLSLLSLFLS